MYMGYSRPNSAATFLSASSMRLGFWGGEKGRNGLFTNSETCGFVSAVAIFSSPKERLSSQFYCAPRGRDKASLAGSASRLSLFGPGSKPASRRGGPNWRRHRGKLGRSSAAPLRSERASQARQFSWACGRGLWRRTPRPWRAEGPFPDPQGERALGRWAALHPGHPATPPECLSISSPNGRRRNPPPLGFAPPGCPCL